MKTPLPPRGKAPTLLGFRSEADTRTYWFSRRGCVVLRESGRRDVFVGASMVGQFEAGDSAMRNLLMVTVARDEHVVLEDLARAFGVVPETVRRIRLAFKAGGVMAVVTRKHGSHGAWKVTPALEAKVVSHFEEGLNQKEVRLKLKGALSAGTLNKMHKKWKAARAVAVEVEAEAKKTPPQAEFALQPELPPSTVPAPESESEPEPEPEPESAPMTGAIEAKKEESSYVVRAEDGGDEDGRTLPTTGVPTENFKRDVTIRRAMRFTDIDVTTSSRLASETGRLRR